MKDWFSAIDESLWLQPDERGAEEAAFIRKALRLRKGMSVLDAPCGAGRVCVHLAHAGCDVTGVDVNPRFIVRARKRFRAEKVKGMFAVMDLRKLDFEAEYHGIFNWGGSFGYFSDEENFDVVRRYARALRPGGRLLIDEVNRENVLRNFRAKQQSGRVTMSARWDAKTQRVHSNWVISKSGRRVNNRFFIRLYTPAQMCALFDRAGLEIDALYGGRVGEKYGRTSRRLIVVGRKPAAR
jgi:SAM-dependent methyltransferase